MHAEVGRAVLAACGSLSPQPACTQGLRGADRDTRVHQVGRRGCGLQDPPLQGPDSKGGGECRPRPCWVSGWDVDAVLPPLRGTSGLSGQDAPVPAGLCARGPASQLRNPFPGHPGSLAGSVEWEGAACRPLKSPWFGAGRYLAQQLVHLHGLYLKAAGGLKIEEFRLSRECVRLSVSWATPGSGPCPSLLQLGRRAGAQLRVPAPPTLAWACRTTFCPPAVFPSLGGYGAMILYMGEGRCAGAHGGPHFGPGPLGLCDANTLAPPEGWPISVSTGLSGPGGSPLPRQMVQWQMPCLAGWELKLGTVSSPG